MNHPEPTYPPDHRNQAAIRVPKGGSSCATCKFLGDDKKSCDSEYYIKWNNGDKRLLAPADSFCSDWYTPKSGTGLFAYAALRRKRE